MAKVKRLRAVKVMRRCYRRAFGVTLRVTDLATGEQWFERTWQRVWTRNV